MAFAALRVFAEPLRRYAIDGGTLGASDEHAVFRLGREVQNQAETMATLSNVRRRLLELHKALVDVEREDHERAHGRMADRAFLDALIKDPTFAWLGALTALIVRIDELQDEDSAPTDLPRDYAAEIRDLLKPSASGSSFQRKYEQVLQRSPHAVVAHGAVIRSLNGSA